MLACRSSFGGIFIEDVDALWKKYCFQDSQLPDAIEHVTDHRLWFSPTRGRSSNISSNARPVLYPHRGSDAAAWGVTILNCTKALGQGPHDELVRSLPTSSKRSSVLVDDFTFLTKSFRIKLTCFLWAEGNALPKIVRLPVKVYCKFPKHFNRVQLTSNVLGIHDMGQVVTQGSASLDEHRSFRSE